MEKRNVALWIVAAAWGSGAVAPPANAAAHPQPRCHAVFADLVEDFATVGCKPSEANCYLGRVKGNRGLRGTTHFKGDGSAVGPANSPGWFSYSGRFEYTTPWGTLVARETGVVHTAQGNPESGALTAFQKIVEGTGVYRGTTGHLFVSGFNIGGHVVTKVTGRLCRP